MFKDNIHLTSEMLEALAHPLRLRIVKKLQSGPCCVCKIYAQIKAEQSNVSHHLAILRRAGVVHCERKGTWVWYRISNSRIIHIIDLVEQCVAANLIQQQSWLKPFLRDRRKQEKNRLRSYAGLTSARAEPTAVQKRHMVLRKVT